MKQAVMYGGGNIGRGFIGATLSQSGYEVTFIDVAEPVVKALQEKKQYPVRYVSSEGHEDVTIEHVTAVNGNDQEAASEAIANCDIMATAVGARILKFIVGNIVAGLRKRWARDDRPLNIIICENLMDANKVMEGMLKDLLTDEEKKHFDEKVGLVEASIGRMVPVQTEEMKDTYRYILECDLLIIDDLGTELNNSFTSSQLFYCINERMNMNRSTIISTNLSLTQLRDSYTDRVTSRIMRYRIIPLYGRDIRLLKR